MRQPASLLPQVALVTGGSSGIGLEISKQLGECVDVFSGWPQPVRACSRPTLATPHCDTHSLLLLPTGLHGAKVVITGRRREVLDAAVAELSAAGVTASGLQGDVRSAEACGGWVSSTVQQYGHLDILVNCAAGNFLANAAELSQGGFKTGVRVGG